MAWLRPGATLHPQNPVRGHAGDTARQSKLMAAMDHINQAMGRRTLFYANSGIQQKWSGASARKSPAYTTDWDSLIHVKAI